MVQLIMFTVGKLGRKEAPRDKLIIGNSMCSNMAFNQKENYESLPSNDNVSHSHTLRLSDEVLSLLVKINTAI